jgi:hypothetical protein
VAPAVRVEQILDALHAFDCAGHPHEFGDLIFTLEPAPEIDDPILRFDR